MRKGQITLEATIIFVVCAFALVTMQGYLRRAMMGSWRNNADSFSDGQYNGDPATETTSPLRFISPNMGIDLNDDHTMDASVNIATRTYSNVENLNGTGVLLVDGWGSYYNSENHEN